MGIMRTKYKCPRCPGKGVVTIITSTAMNFFWCDCGFSYEEDIVDGITISHPDVCPEDFSFRLLDAFPNASKCL
jgi:hypothetical protein